MTPLYPDVVSPAVSSDLDVQERGALIFCGARFLGIGRILLLTTIGEVPPAPTLRAMEVPAERHRG